MFKWILLWVKNRNLIFKKKLLKWLYEIVQFDKIMLKNNQICQNFWRWWCGEVILNRSHYGLRLTWTIFLEYYQKFSLQLAKNSWNCQIFTYFKYFYCNSAKLGYTGNIVHNKNLTVFPNISFSTIGTDLFIK